MMGAGSFAAAADKKLKADLGKREYENSCALCHYMDAPYDAEMFVARSRILSLIDYLNRIQVK